MKFPINRLSPFDGQPHSRVLGYLPAGVVAANNATYRAEFASILDISPEDEFPILEGPAGFGFAGWLPDEAFLRRVYEEVIDHSRTVTETVGYRRALLELASGFLRAVESSGAAPPLRLLDYGCGYGSLLRMLASRDVQAFGYEPSAARGAHAEQRGLKILSELEAVAAAGPFDLAICTEVLEHMADPRSALRFLKANMKSGGLLAVTVPNCGEGYLQASIAGIARGSRLSPVFNPWEHLNYFSNTSLRRMLAEEGFEVAADFGRTRAMHDACARFGDLPAGILLNSLRIAKRAWVAKPTTDLFCRCR